MKCHKNAPKRRCLALITAVGLAASSGLAMAGDLLFTSNQEGGVFQLYRLDERASAPARVTAQPAEATDIALSPDGKSVAMVSYRAGQPDLVLVDLASGALRRLTDDRALEATPVWTPDGQRLVFQSYRDRQALLYVLDIADGQVRRLTQDAGGRAESGPAVSRDGRQVAYIQFQGRREAQIRSADLTTGITRAVGREPAEGNESEISWSPDGRQIAYVRLHKDRTHVYVMDADGSNARALTQGDSMNNSPEWSPDGRHLLFLSIRNGANRQSVYRMAADGSAQQEIAGGPEEHLLARWSADGRDVVFVRMRNGAGQLFAVSADGGAERPLPSGSGYAADLAVPDATQPALRMSSTR